MSSPASVPHRVRGRGPADTISLSHRTKLVLYTAGTALFVASLAYVGVRIANQWGTLRNTQIESGGWLAASIVIYAISHVSTALAWPLALRVIGERLPLRVGMKIGLVAQIGKYLPGNVAHYFGRAALAKTAGVTLTSSGLSTLVEVACALVAASLLAPSVLFAGTHLGAAVLLVPVLIAVAVILAISMTVRGKFATRTEAVSYPFFAAASLAITISLLLSGLSAYCVFVSLSAPVIPWWHVVGAFALAWLAGLLTPGAPGGLGVRESVFVGLLGPQVGLAAALAAALLHRLVTAVVDFAAGVLGYAWLASGMRSNT